MGVFRSGCLAIVAALAVISGQGALACGDGAKTPPARYGSGRTSGEATRIAALQPSTEVGAYIYGVPDKPVMFERPDFLEPKNLSPCEQRHLGGPWATGKLTAVERQIELAQLRAALANVRHACATGRDAYLP